MGTDLMPLVNATIAILGNDRIMGSRREDEDEIFFVGFACKNVSVENCNFSCLGERCLRLVTENQGKRNHHAIMHKFFTIT
jgi:hypothetical protein